jgi:hypothetical protein
MDERQRNELRQELLAALDSHDAAKMHAAWSRAQVLESVWRLEQPAADGPRAPAVTGWQRLVAGIAGVVLPIAGLLAWAHASLSKDIDRVDRAIGEARQEVSRVRDDLSAFKDQSSSRLAEIQGEISAASKEAAALRADLAPKSANKSATRRRR